MNSLLAGFFALVFIGPVVAEPLLEGRVRLGSGELVADAQVRLFDMSDLRQGAIARATTDGTGYFALPLASLGGHALPQGFALGPNYPNPFNPSTIIPYQLAALSEVRLEVFNLLGQRLATLVDGERSAGFHTATWNATDGAGRAVGAGVYIYRMTVGAASQTGRMVLVDGQAGVAASGVASVWSGAAGSGLDGVGAQVYGLIVSGEGLVPYVDSSFRVEAGMAPVELVVSEGPYSAGKVTDDDCALCGLFDVFGDQQEEEEETEEEAAETDSTASEGGADLIVQDSKKNLSRTPGQFFSLVAVVSNQGDGQSAATTLTYYRSTNATISTSDTEVGTDIVEALAVGTGFRIKSIRLTAPSSAGTYYYGACVASVAGESNTDNNCSCLMEMTIRSGSTVAIPDAKLRAAIAKALGKASGATITKGDMETLTTLGAVEAGLRDLTGLEFATNLRELILSYNAISDISPLSGLTNLRWLRLDANAISDISPLSGLTNLRSLILWNNAISDISPLSGLTNLRWLRLDANAISDISPLSGLTNLRWLRLDANAISDISPLSGLTNLTELILWDNAISDISALRGLTNLRWLGLRLNPLSVSSINDHIPALQRSGATVRFDPPLRESDFDIELVFLDDHFDERNKRVIQYAARRWMSIIREDLPDYTFTGGWSEPCGGRSYAIPSGERIDDLRIYVVSFNDDDDDAPAGWAGPDVLRETSYLSVVGCMGFNDGYNVSPDTALHEIGHVLGIGARPWDNNGFVQKSPNDVHFNGPLAIAAFNDAGGRNYTGKKVPLEEDWAHWRESVLSGELMEPGGGDVSLSAITIQSLADIGYSVDVTQADPYTLPRAAAKVVAAGSTPDDHLPGRLVPQRACGVGQQHEPIHVVDPQGRIVRTLHR